MKNYGNTCYCNAILQCLKNTPPTRPSVDRSLRGVREHKDFVFNLSRFGKFGRFACDASELLLKIIDEVDAYTGEFRSQLVCSVCSKVERRLETCTIVYVCDGDDITSLLTRRVPEEKYVCDCGGLFRAETTFYAGDCLVLQFVREVSLDWVQSICIKSMRLVAMVFYTGNHYTAYRSTATGWKTFDDERVYSKAPQSRPYLAFFVNIKALEPS